MKRNINDLVKQLTVEEKAGLCSGLDFWHTKPVARLGIPSVMVSDGPCGLRKQDTNGDHLGVNDSIKAVCFPSGCLTACSFDKALLQKEGETIADEALAENVSVVLGPAVNIKRSPLCGRNFEYFSEDPYLAGEMASSWVKGVQSKNVGTSVKHFAANSQEFRRMTSSSNVDERTLREIYFPAFEKTVKEGNPDTVMCSYNKINGVFASENKWLLTDVLRKEWGFKGYVVSDWAAVNDRVKGLVAGLDLEMPASGGSTDAQIVAAVKSGKLKETVLDKAVSRILRIVFKYVDGKTEGNFDKQAHHKIVCDIARESMVLLKNEKNLLPLSEKDAEKILFVGTFAKKPRYEGGGSSHINTWKVTSALDAAKEAGLNVKYVQGYDLAEKKDKKLLEEAVSTAKLSKAVVIFAGLPDSYESEGYDRNHICLPQNQNVLISEIAKVNKNVVVLLHNGAPIELPWINDVKSVLECYLAGEAVGYAQLDLLFGKANPCGKLAETFPIRLEDNPSYLNFGGANDVNYAEGLYVGYRYYDKKNMNVLFPFGHGLSYTTFEYSNIKLSSKNILDGDELVVSVTVKNTGKRAGKEIVQLYVAPCKNETVDVDRPLKELKGFEKVFLKPGESKTITMTLDKRSFAFYDTNIHDWRALTGVYEILVGSSSRDIKLCANVNLTSTTKVPFVVDDNTVMADIMQNPIAAKVMQPILEARAKNNYDASQGASAEEAINEAMQESMLSDTPLRALRSFAQIPQSDIEKVVEMINTALKE